MKKLFFSFVMLVTLVIVAGSAKGQSTASAPFVNATHAYSVAGLKEADICTFIVTASSNTTLPLVAVAGTVYSDDNGTKTLGTAEVSITDNITWKTAGSYNVWIQVKNGTTGCYNYRYFPVTVTAYQVQFTALAITAGDDPLTTDITSPPGSASVNDCPGFVSPNFLTTSYSDGSSYIYYKVVRSVVSGTPSTSDWKFTPSTTGVAATSWDYSYNATTWNTITMASEFTALGANNIVYIRAKITNVTELAQKVNFTIGTASSSTAFEVTGNIKDNSTGDDVSDLTLNVLPAIGTFSGN